MVTFKQLLLSLILIHDIIKNHPCDVMVCAFFFSAIDREIDPDRVKPKIIILVFAASQISMYH